jgi:hypothetical protein
VTCQELREWFSARVDDALSADERTRLDAHLAACAECAVEWRRFERAVGLLRATAAARAPAGFVDRVLAARPRPWYRRLARRLFVPWPVKLPLEAAAIVLVAGLAIMVFQRSPELRQAAGLSEPPARVPAPAAPPSTAAPDPVPAPPSLERKQALADAPPSLKLEPRSTDARPGANQARDAAGGRPAPGAATDSPAKRAEAPAASERREADTSSVAGVQQASPLRGWLVVEDPAAAERAVGEIVTRAGGRMLARAEEPAALVLTLVVPGDRWGEARRGLAALGSLRVEGERERSADLLPVSLRLER